MIDDHRTAGGDRFLHRRASGFANKQMALVQHAGKFIGPTNDLCWATIYRRFDRRPKFMSAANRHGQIDSKVCESPDQFRRTARRGMDHV